MNQGVEKFLAVIHDSVQEALKSIQDSDTDTLLLDTSPRFAAAWFGISGVDTPTFAQSLSNSLSQLLSVPLDRCIVANETSLLAAPLVTAALQNPKIQNCGMFVSPFLQVNLPLKIE